MSSAERERVVERYIYARIILTNCFGEVRNFAAVVEQYSLLLGDLQLKQFSGYLIFIAKRVCHESCHLIKIMCRTQNLANVLFIS